MTPTNKVKPRKKLTRSSRTASVHMFKQLQGKTKPIGRIDTILNFLKREWQTTPTQSFGQLIYRLKMFKATAGENFDTQHFDDDIIMDNMGIPARDRVVMKDGSGEEVLLRDLNADYIRDLIMDGDDLSADKLKQLKEEMRFRKDNSIE